MKRLLKIGAVALVALASITSTSASGAPLIIDPFTNSTGGLFGFGGGAVPTQTGSTTQVGVMLLNRTLDFTAASSNFWSFGASGGELALSPSSLSLGVVANAVYSKSGGSPALIDFIAAGYSFLRLDYSVSTTTQNALGYKLNAFINGTSAPTINLFQTPMNSLLIPFSSFANNATFNDIQSLQLQFLQQTQGATVTVSLYAVQGNEIPEPATYLLMGAGLAAVAFFRRHRV